VLWLHHAMSMAPAGRVDRVLLVAPPGPGLFAVPELATFTPVDFDPRRLAASSRAPIRLVCSDDDPYCPEGAATVYGEPLGLDVDLLPGTQHLNPDSGHGPWPDALAWALDPTHRFTAGG
jgi:predicted alpha/beta hydrolase family esterase